LNLRSRGKQMEDKFIGCLLGCATGDAAGAPVEAKGPVHCQRYINNHLRRRAFSGVLRIHKGRFPFGQITDDTQLTREMVLSINEVGIFSPEHFAQRLLKLFQGGKSIGSGRSTRAAVENLAQGIPWHRAGSPPEFAGNGSAMRAGPIGLLHWKSSDEVFLEDAIDQSLITHTNPLSSAGSVAISGAVRLLLRQKDPQTSQWWDELARLVSEVDKNFGQHIQTIWDLRDHDWGKIIEIIEAPTWNSGRKWEGVSPYVVTSVLWALFSFLQSPGDFWETICTAIWPGGDVDTTAAMAGALSGTYNGIGAIPQEVLDLITDQGEWGYPELRVQAEKLFRIAS
jgi:ADP-ribosylglycohydrolase